MPDPAFGDLRLTGPELADSALRPEDAQNGLPDADAAGSVIEAAEFATAAAAEDDATLAGNELAGADPVTSEADTGADQHHLAAAAAAGDAVGDAGSTAEPSEAGFLAHALIEQPARPVIQIGLLGSTGRLAADDDDAQAGASWTDSLAAGSVASGRTAAGRSAGGTAWAAATPAHPRALTLHVPTGQDFARLSERTAALLAAISRAGLTWAKRRDLGPTSLAGISLALAVCAAAWFSAGTTTGMIRGAIALGICYLALVTGRKLSPSPARGLWLASPPTLSDEVSAGASERDASQDLWQGSEQPGSEQPGSEQPGSEQPGSEQPGSESPGQWSGLPWSAERPARAPWARAPWSKSGRSKSRRSGAPWADVRQAGAPWADTRRSALRWSATEETDARVARAPGSGAQGSGAAASRAPGSSAQGSRTQRSRAQGFRAPESSARRSRAPGSRPQRSSTQESRAPESTRPGSRAPAAGAQRSRAPGSRPQRSSTQESSAPESTRPGSRAPAAGAQKFRAPGSRQRGEASWPGTLWLTDPVRTAPWLAALGTCLAECIAYAGLAVGAFAAGWTRMWPLAVGVVGLVAVRNLMTACSTPPGFGDRADGIVRRIAAAALTMPLGGRILLVAVVAPVWGARTALLALLDWGIISIGFGIAGRAAAAATGERDEQESSWELIRLRDDGMLARSLGMIVRGSLLPLPPAILGIAATAALALVGLHDLPGALMIAPAIVLMLAAPGSAHAHTGRFDWLVPVLLLGAQVLYLGAIGLARGVPGPVVYVLIAALLLRYTDLAFPGRPVMLAGERQPGQEQAERGSALGWEGRVLIAGVAAAMGIATFAYVALAAYLGVLICVKAMASSLALQEDTPRDRPGYGSRRRTPPAS